MQTTKHSRLEQASDAARATTAPAPPGAVALPTPDGGSEAPMQRFRARTGVSAARAAGATVLLDLHTGLYHTLNEPAGRLWDAIESGDATLASLIDVLRAEHVDVPRETIAKDVMRWVETLVDAGVIAVEQTRSDAVARGEAAGGAA